MQTSVLILMAQSSLITRPSMWKPHTFFHLEVFSMYRNVGLYFRKVTGYRSTLHFTNDTRDALYLKKHWMPWDLWLPDPILSSVSCLCHMIGVKVRGLHWNQEVNVKIIRKKTDAYLLNVFKYVVVVVLMLSSP